MEVETRWNCYPQHVGILARTGPGEGGRGRRKHTAREKRKVEGGNMQLGKKRRRRRRNRREAQKLRADVRAGPRAEELVVGTFNVCTLAFDGKNGTGRNGDILKVC